MDIPKYMAIRQGPDNARLASRGIVNAAPGKCNSGFGLAGRRNPGQGHVADCFDSTSFLVRAAARYVTDYQRRSVIVARKGNTVVGR